MKRKLLFLAASIFLSAAVCAEPPLYPFKNGIRPPTPEQKKYLEERTVKITRVQPNGTAMKRSSAAPGAMPGLPSSVNNVQYLPKVGDQGMQGSCVGWSTCYYYKTYQEAKEHGWGSPDYSTDPDHVISPAFCYNLENFGQDNGSYPLWMMDLMAGHGAATWKEMPYTDRDYTTWPSSAAWKSAIAYREQSAGTIDLSKDAGITALKQQLANGDLAVVDLPVTASFDHYPDDYAGVNNQVMYDNAGGIRGGHALAVVGYDDNKSYNDGTGTKYGAFKIVNSWGSGWGILDPTVGTKGFIWISYTYMRDKSDQEAFTMVDRVSYQPSAYGTFGLNHAQRGDLNVTFMGGNDKNHPDWSFAALTALGGSHAVNQKIVVDLSDFSPDFHNKFWLKVNDSASHSDTGQITFLGAQQAGDTEKVSTDTPKNTQNGSDVFVLLSGGGGAQTTLDPVFTQVNISSLTVAWDQVPGADYVAVLSNDSFYTSIRSSATQSLNSLTVTGLSAGVRYYFQVKIATETDDGYYLNRVSANTSLITWPPAASMLSARGAHTATLLQSGKVLVTGGVGGGYLSTAELYDPGTNSWSAAGTMAASRYDHTATQLPDGRVLVTGGVNNGSYLSSAEIYDPETNAWSRAAPMSSARYLHAATLLLNGKVLVSGGLSGSDLDSLLPSSELYDPETNSWSGLAAMSSGRYSPATTLLSGGKVLVTGGYSSSGYLSSAEVYYPGSNSWTGAAAMPSARGYHTATLLSNGRVLVAGGYNNGFLNSAAVYDPQANSWAGAGSMSAARYDHTATLLSNGRVLAAGGSGGSPLASAEVYDPAADAWIDAGIMSSGRQYHTATLLPGGEVLVAGGYYGGGYLASAELSSYYGIALTSLRPAVTQAGYTSLTAAWTAMPAGDYTVTLSTDANFINITSSGQQSAASAVFSALSPGSRYFFAVRLSTEAGWAFAGNRVSTATLSPTSLSWTGGVNYVSDGLDPETGTSTTTFVYQVKYANANSAAPLNGYPKVHIKKSGVEISGSPFTMDYVSGGFNTGAVYSYSRGLATWTDDYTYYFEAYSTDTSKAVGEPVFARDAPDVYDGAWAGAAGMTSARAYHAATQLPDGRVLITGGNEPAELYSPGTNSWASAGNMASWRQEHTATLLGNGKVLVAGGYNNASAELYDPHTNTWTGAAPMAAAREAHTATLLANGRVLVAGGYGSSSALSSAELYDPGTGAWSNAGSMAYARYMHAATLLPDGRVLVTGGSGNASAELYDPGTNTWSSAASMSSGRYRHTSNLLQNGRVLVAGGYDGYFLSSSELYDPNTNTWSAAGSMVSPRGYHTATLLSDGKVLAAGGYNSSYLSSSEIYYPNTDTWVSAAPMASPRGYHTATLLAGGRVLVTGGFNANSLSSAELFSLYGSNGIPFVYDGLGADRDGTSSLSVLSANWGASADAEHYEFGIGTSPGGLDVRGWTANGVALSTTVAGLGLSENSKYYFSARAFSNSGVYSGVATSNGQIVDITSPTASVLLGSTTPAGSGPLDLKLIVNDANVIVGKPVLAFTPPGGAPRGVPLTFLAASTWTGTAFIESFFSTGTANFAFSAVDLAGNTGAVLSSGGSFLVDSAVDGAAGGSASNSDGAAAVLPAGSYNGSLRVTISTVAAVRTSAADAADQDTLALQHSDMPREFAAKDGSSGLPVANFPSPVSIRLCYPDADNDGKIDGDNLSERLAWLYWLDEAASRWVKVPGAVRDTVSNCITARTPHFSVYSIRVLDPSKISMANIKAFPNPCYFDRSGFSITGIPADAERAKVSFYNTAGELVRELAEGDGLDAFNTASWNGRNKSGEKVASGLYIYVITSANYGSKRDRVYVFW